MHVCCQMPLDNKINLTLNNSSWLKDSQLSAAVAEMTESKMAVENIKDISATCQARLSEDLARGSLVESDRMRSASSRPMSGRKTSYVWLINGNSIYFGILSNSSDRKFDTKLISILYAYMANLKYFINTQLNLIWKLFQRASKADLVEAFCSFGLGSVMILIMMVKGLSFLENFICKSFNSSFLLPGS